MIDRSKSSNTTARPLAGRWQTVAPIAVLIFLSPVLTELLMGVVHITNLWLLVPEMGVYGVAALLIREAVRRQGKGWGTILLLGIAYALAEECVILQTSLTLQFFSLSGSGAPTFGWAAGVQWSYLIAMLVYESVYAIVISIALTELLFHEQRNDPWLSRRGIVIAGVVFLLASVGVWWLWRNVGLQRYGGSTAQISLLNVGISTLIIIIMVAATLSFRARSRAERPVKRRAWSPWLLGPIAFIFALFWWILVVLAYIPASSLPGVSPIIPLGIGVLWAILAFLVVRYLSTANGWQDRHRLALIIGALLASMLGGTLSILAAAPIDRIGKLVFDLVAIILLSILAWRIRKRGRANQLEEVGALQ